MISTFWSEEVFSMAATVWCDGAAREAAGKQRQLIGLTRIYLDAHEAELGAETGARRNAAAAPAGEASTNGERASRGTVGPSGRSSIGLPRYARCP